ncbi:MAG: B12-binding domain-containing radical SAM protein [Candidatus Wallbacteria bacterium]|nr:B12-binding domain-containing radical SAM protein [Candidatus Wallbacteria bacterium]
MTPRVQILNVAPSPNGPAARHNRLWYHGLTLPYLAALFSRHAEVRVADELLEALPAPDRIEADLVALSVMGAALPRALEYARSLRAAGLKVVMGGPTATAHAALASPSVDSLVAGDGEGLVDALMTDLAAGTLKPLYAHGELPSLDDTPVPRYDLVDRRRVGLYFPVEATRGCTVGCRFCLTSHLRRRLQRRKPIANVVRDVRALAAMGIRRVTFTDDNPAADRRYFRELASAMGELGVDWITNVTADVAEDDSLLDLLAASGCETLSIGFETVEQASLDAVGKGSHCKSDRYVRAVERVHERGMQVLAMMVVGFDHDTPETFERIRDFLSRAKVDIAVFHVLTPVHGTPLWEQLSAEDRLLTRDLADYTAERAVFRPAHMTASELDAHFWDLYRQVYSLRGIARRLLTRSPGAHVGRRVATLAANLYMRHEVLRGRTVV